MYKKTTLILLLFIGLLYGKSVNIHPMLKSAILPGWGEAALEKPKRARIFRLTEVSLISACISAYTFSGHQANQYKSFAAKHAGVNSHGKNHEYWVAIGNYIDMSNYNDEHLRFRDMGSIYEENEGWDWNWDSKNNKKLFETMRIRSDLLALTGKFIIGGIVVNHILSSIDALYLTRIEKIESISFMPTISPNGMGFLSLKVEFHL